MNFLGQPGQLTPQQLLAALSSNDDVRTAIQHQLSQGSNAPQAMEEFLRQLTGSVYGAAQAQQGVPGAASVGQPMNQGAQLQASRGVQAVSANGQISAMPQRQDVSANGHILPMGQGQGVSVNGQMPLQGQQFTPRQALQRTPSIGAQGGVNLPTYNAPSGYDETQRQMEAVSNFSHYPAHTLMCSCKR